MQQISLSDALKVIVEKNGKEAVYETGIVVSLERLGVFSGMPALKFIYRAAFESGTLKRFVSFGDSEGNRSMIIDRFIVSTGFQPEKARYVFNSVSYALGQISTTKPEIPVDLPEEPAGNNSNRKMPSENLKWDSQWDIDTKNRHITDLIELDHERDSRTGIVVVNPCCIKTDPFSVTVSFETERKRPMATGALYFTVYSPENLVLDCGAAAVVCFNNSSRRSTSLIIKVPPQKIASIRFYWD